MNRHNALYAGNDEGGRDWACCASLFGARKINGVGHPAHIRDLLFCLAKGLLAKDIEALMPRADGPSDQQVRSKRPLAAPCQYLARRPRLLLSPRTRRAWHTGVFCCPTTNHASHALTLSGARRHEQQGPVPTAGRHATIGATQ